MAQPTALHVPGAMVDTEAEVTAHTRAHLIPIPHLGVAAVAQAIAVNHGGLNLVHRYRNSSSNTVPYTNQGKG